jgi:hypothetical protein
VPSGQECTPAVCASSTTSPRQGMASKGGDGTLANARQCVCSPTTHPGSCRCRLHPMPRSASCQQFSAPGPPIALHRPHEEGRVAAAVRASKLYRQRCRHGAVGFGTAVPALCTFADIGVVARVCSKGVLTKDPISIWLKKWRSLVSMNIVKTVNID